ncbi:MAG: DUF2914 domain-containing protein [Desulfobacteraceae bacterium]|nr:DUF2914 domain-containing protein [Desulfobacteraceae bacterium]
MNRLNPFYCIVVLVLSATVAFGDTEGTTGETDTPKLSLQSAVMCESIQGYSPVNSSVIFSISIGKVACFSFFNPVPDKTFVEHRWYHRDKLSTTKKLSVNPPKWATYSSIQLREADKGPWRVDIIDDSGHKLETLRFSITD